MEIFRVRKVRETSGTTSGGTLDSVHQETVGQLRDRMSSRPQLEEERAMLSSQLDALSSDMTIEGVLRANTLRDKITEIDKQLQTTHPVEDYYMKHMDLLMDYHTRKQTPADTSSSFFKYVSTPSAPEPTGPSRKQMYEEYLQRLQAGPPPDATTRVTEHCVDCNIAREEITSEGVLVCPRCGSEEYTLVVSDFPSFRDPPKERTNYAYKKVNHLNEILNQLQGRESTCIPEEVMNEIVVEIRKRRIDNIATLTEEDIRQILKKLNRSKYYEHRAHILSRLNGNPPPTITPEIEEKIRQMFQEIQAPFLMYCPNDRTNFLSYSYILYKFFELLELDEYKVYFPLLKSRDRLIAHDQIWRKICDDLNWEFISSV